MGAMTVLTAMATAMPAAMQTAMGTWGPGNGPGNGPDGDFWWVGRVLFLLLWIAVIALVVRWVTRRRERHDESSVARRHDGVEPSPLDRARGILAERYAWGEIDADEYRLRSEQLR